MRLPWATSFRADDLVDIQLVLANTALGPTEEGGNPERRESRVVLQALRVLSVGEALTEEAGDRAIRMQNLTVAVTSEQALVLAVAKQSGSLTSPCAIRRIRPSSR